LAAGIGRVSRQGDKDASREMVFHVYEPWGGGFLAHAQRRVPLTGPRLPTIIRHGSRSAQRLRDFLDSSEPLRHQFSL
jgi:hypothetical protein